MDRQGFRFIVCVASLAWVSAVFVLPLREAEAQGRGKKRPKEAKPYDLKSWGKILKAPKEADGFYELEYYKRNSKGKLKKNKAFLKIPGKVVMYKDVAVRSKQLQEGDKVAIFGEPITHEHPARTGAGALGTHKEYHIKTARVVLAGPPASFGIDETFTHQKSPKEKWIIADVVTTSGSLTVRYQGRDHKVLLVKKAPILKRIKIDNKKVRKGSTVRVFANKSKTRPETQKKADAKKGSFEATRIILMDRRYTKTAYPLMWGKT